MSSRRTFIKKSSLAGLALTLVPTISCKNNITMKPKISLAQWSLHRALEKGRTKAIDFAQVAKNDYGIDAIEYVNQFYVARAIDETFWNMMKETASNVGVQSLLIMVDNEGDLGNPSETERKTSVQNHFKWIHAAKIMGCHSIRVNAFGKGTEDELRSALVDGLGQLAAYGKQVGINVLIENHGLHTSDGKFMTAIIKEVNNPYLGTLPDFGNWCLETEWGSTQQNKCDRVYDRYLGVSELLPYAKGVSAKSYAFDAEGNETIMDYTKLLKMVRDSGFEGHIGIEFEGENMEESDGIRATKALIEKTWAGMV